MSILKELLALTEAERATRATVEINTIFAKAKHDLAKAKELLAFVERNGSGTWHGDRIVVNGDGLLEDGPVYRKIDSAVKHFLKGDFEISIDQELDVSDLAGESAPGHIELSFKSEVDVQEANLVYIGYDPVKDKMYAGYDIWASQDSFDEAFDSAFEKATGIDFDIEDEEHYAVLDKLHKEFNEKFMYWGVVFEVSNNGGSYQVDEALPAMPGGFYKAVQEVFLQHHKNVVKF